MATKKKKSFELTDVTLEKQLKSLGLSSKAEYKTWCSTHGFSTSTSKSNQQYRDELSFVARQKADKFLTKTKQFFRRPEILIQDYLDGKDISLPKFAEKLTRLRDFIGQVDAYGHFTDEVARKSRMELVKELVAAIPTDFLFANVYKTFQFLECVPSLLKYKAHWLRNPADWKCKTHNLRRQFASFLRHLFDKGYNNIPLFMDQVWFPENGRLENILDWYIHLGTGANIRTVDNLPIPFTKRMSHYFMQAPDDVDINEGIRYGHMMSLGANITLFTAMRGTLICRSLSGPRTPATAPIQTEEYQEFWGSVIRWFIANPMLDLVHVGPLIDYLNNQKFERQRVVQNGIGEWLPPPHPNLSMKNRDVMATIRAMEVWHKQLGRAKKAGNLQWESSGIPDFELQQGSEQTRRVWHINELCSSAELIKEGRAMSHCVASYAHSCVSGNCSVFSLMCWEKGSMERRLTLEVRNRQVVQARGKYNAKANEQEQKIISQWASKNSLTVSSYI